jgi:S4 domain protein YaaA
MEQELTNETTFAVHGDHITLGQLVKLVGVAGTGGEAKMYVADEEIHVNGEPENRRGRKLRPGDRVELPGFGVVLLTAPESGE